MILESAPLHIKPGQSEAFEAAFREARSAVGAQDLLARAEEHRTVAQAVADCSLVVGTTAVGPRELQHPLKRLEEGARLIRKRLRAGKVALLFGSEKGRKPLASPCNGTRWKLIGRKIAPRWKETSITLSLIHI